MYYEKSPFNNANEYTGALETSPSMNTPIYKDPIKRETIYEKVKIHKPIVVTVPYKGSNYSTQNNYTTYVNPTYSDNNNYNNLIYGQTTTTTTDTNNAYNYNNYNIDSNTYNKTTNTIENYNYETQGNTNYTNYTDYTTTNYDYNNLIYGQNATTTTNLGDTNNYNDIIYNQDNSPFTDNNTYNTFNTYNTYNTYNNKQAYTTHIQNLNTNNNSYSLPYITAVADNNEITHPPKTKKFETNKIKFNHINKLENQINTNVNYEQPKAEKTLLSPVNNLFGYKSYVTKNIEFNNNPNANISQEIYNNINTNNIETYSKMIKPLINPQTKKEVVKEAPLYETHAKVRKITEEENIIEINNNNYENINTNINTNINSYL